MADIELVIKIEEETYNRIMNGWMPLHKAVYLMENVQKGILLPKGHGRLIDADELKRHKYHDNNRFENAVAVAQIDWADTIIEADKEE